MESYGLFLVVTAIVAFYSSFMGGANDLANSMGTSVGSGVLTLKKAVLVAAIANYAGALLVGQYVTSTIAKGIVSPMAFDVGSNDFIYGMFAALVSTGIFLHIANHYGLPVSTTHSIVGAVVGFGLIAGGTACVNWKKMGFIVISWFSSPLVGATLAFTIFIFIRRKLLESKDAKRAVRLVLPVFVVFVFSVIILSFLYKGLKNLNLGIPFYVSVLIALVVGLTAGVFVRLRVIRQMKKKKNEYDLMNRAFKSLQVLSASFVAFAHGANDVGNGIGPLAAIANNLGKTHYQTRMGIPLWVLFLGATGIVVGLMVLGYRVIETVGKKITVITPVRGFTAEFGAATTVLFASLLGMPVSTTHTLVGAVIGVGLARGVDAIDMKVVKRIITSWFVTVPAAACFTIVIFLIMKTVLS